MITDEDEYLQNIDCVAFDQEEFADLLDEGITTIYLCGNRFLIPISQKGVTYIGINSPAVHLSGTFQEDISKLGIICKDCVVDNWPIKSGNKVLIQNPVDTPAAPSKVIIPDDLTANLPAKLNIHNAIVTKLHDDCITELLLGFGVPDEQLNMVLEFLREHADVTVDRLARVRWENNIFTIWASTVLWSDAILNGSDSLYLVKMLNDLTEIIQDPELAISSGSQDDEPEKHSHLITALSNALRYRFKDAASFNLLDDNDDDLDDDDL